MVMGVFESRQNGQIRGIQDVGSCADQPVQAMGVLRDRHDPFITDGDGLVERAMPGHGVNGVCTKYGPPDVLPTGYATSEPKGGESPEKLAKTAEMCLPERKRVRKGGEEDD